VVLFLVTVSEASCCFGAVVATSEPARSLPSTQIAISSAIGVGRNWLCKTYPP
jgi:hypothetical protein